jgi:hypothetical protein
MSTASKQQPFHCLSPIIPDDTVAYSIWLPLAKAHAQVPDRRTVGGPLLNAVHLAPSFGDPVIRVRRSPPSPAFDYLLVVALSTVGWPACICILVWLLQVKLQRFISGIAGCVHATPFAYRVATCKTMKHNNNTSFRPRAALKV